MEDVLYLNLPKYFNDNNFETVTEMVFKYSYVNIRVMAVVPNHNFYISVKHISVNTLVKKHIATIFERK